MSITYDEIVYPNDLTEFEASQPDSASIEEYDSTVAECSKNSSERPQYVDTLFLSAENSSGPSVRVLEQDDDGLVEPDFIRFGSSSDA